MIYYTPIWDVLVTEGEQEEVGKHFCMHSRCLAFPIRQAVSDVSLCSLGLLLGSLTMVFMLCISVAAMCVLLLYHFICVWGGRDGWMAVNGFG